MKLNVAETHTCNVVPCIMIHFDILIPKFPLSEQQLQRDSKLYNWLQISFKIGNNLQQIPRCYLSFSCKIESYNIMGE